MKVFESSGDLTLGWKTFRWRLTVSWNRGPHVVFDRGEGVSEQ